MRKKTLVILTILYFVLFIPGIAAIVGGTVLAASQNSCYYSDAYGTTWTCSTSDSGEAIAGLVIGLGALIAVAAIVLGIIAWIGGLVKQARQEQWAWFICTLIFGLLCLAIYLIAVPEQPRYLVQGYVPVYPPMQPYQLYQPQPPYQPYPPQQYQRHPEQPADPWRPS